MPKEVTHWMIAEKVVERLQSSRFKDDLNRNPNIWHYGAVFHDKIYYYSVHKKASDLDLRAKVDDIPSRLHGVGGEDTLDVIRAMVRAAKERKAEGLENGHIVALLTGVVTHIFTDVVWHPMVYYFTGNYYDENPEMEFTAQYNHRKIEGLFDLFFTNGMQGVKEEYYLSRFVDNLEYPLYDLVKESCPYFAKNLPIDDFAGFYVKATESAMLAHKWMRRFWAMDALYPIRNFLPDSIRLMYSAMYHHKLLPDVQRLAGTIKFKNPVTGEEKACTMKELMNEAVEECVRFLLSIEEAIYGDASWDFPEQGRSLEHGQLPGKLYKMNYYEPFFKGF